jgi:hypothetical protein
MTYYTNGRRGRDAPDADVKDEQGDVHEASKLQTREV